MIKFFKQKSTLILFIIATVILAGAYLFTVINPVSYIGSYHAEMEAFGIESEMTFKFKSGSKVDCTESGSFGGMSAEETTEQWYYRKGNRIVILGSTEIVTEEMYEESVKLYEEMTDEEFEENSCEISYGKMMYGYEGLDYEFENTLGFLVSGVVMILAIVAGAGTAVAVVFNVFSKKDKKSTSTQSQN